MNIHYCGRCKTVGTGPAAEHLHNNIDKPSHYTSGIETWDYIVSHGMNYLGGNIIKYVTRYKQKNGREDLLKAQAYLNRLLKEIK